jgi:hypothetical protein
MTGALVMMSGMVVFGFVLLILARRGERWERDQRQKAGKP